MSFLKTHYLDPFSLFWIHHPLCLYALASFLALQSVFSLEQQNITHFFLSLLIALFAFSPLFRSPFVLKGFLALSLFFSFGLSFYSLSSLPSGTEEGEILFWVSTLKKQENFGKGYVLQGSFWRFKGGKESFFFKGAVLLPTGVPLPKSSLIHCKGTLEKKETDGKRDCFIFSLAKGSKIQEKGVFPLALYRFEWKEAFYLLLEKHYGGRTLPFIYSLFTGENKSKEQTLTFHRFGLDHVLAVSGFHFALLLAFLHRVLSLFLKGKKLLFILFLALFSYFIFLGPLPSVMRSFFSLFFLFFSLFINKNTYSLNALGGSILFLLFLDPYLSQSEGFLLSVLATFSLLLFYPLLRPFFQKLSPKRPFFILRNSPFFSLFLLKILDLFIKSLGVMVAIFLCLFPFLLKLNGSIPLLGIFFQIFFPLLTIPALTLFFCALFTTPFFPLIASKIHTLTYLYTESILKGLYEVPLHFDFNLYFNSNHFNIPLETLIPLLLFSLSISLKEKESFYP